MKRAAFAKQQEQAVPQRRSSRSSDPLDAFIKSTVRGIGSQVGRQLVRGIMGALIK